MTDRARDALAGVPDTARAGVPVIFTAHSIPVPMAEASPYVTDLTAAARARRAVVSVRSA